MRRFPFAFLLVGALGLLAAGGAILGAFEAPTGTDLAVHNGAGETLEANKVVGIYTASNLKDIVTFVFTAPDHATEVAKTAGGTVQGRRTVEGATAVGILQPVRALLSLQPFTQHGAVYRVREPAADLVPAYQRSAVSGVYSADVRIAGGYVVRVDYKLDAVEGGQPVKETLHYRLTEVGSWKGS